MRKNDDLPTIPRELYAALLADASPEMNELLADLAVLDAAQIGLLAAQTRAANQGRRLPWLDHIARIISTEMAAVAKRVKAGKRGAA